jgi:hypothetical protein
MIRSLDTSYLGPLLNINQAAIPIVAQKWLASSSGLLTIHFLVLVRRLLLPKCISHMALCFWYQKKKSLLMSVSSGKA